MASSWSSLVRRAMERARAFGLSDGELARLEADIRFGCEIARGLGAKPAEVVVSLESDRPGHCRMLCHSAGPGPVSAPSSKALH